MRSVEPPRNGREKRRAELQRLGMEAHGRGEVIANLPHKKGDRMNIKLPFITLDDLDDILFRDDDPDYHDEEIEPDVFDDIRRLEDERCTQ